MKIFGKCWFVYQGLYIIIYTIFFYTNCIFFLFRHILVATFNNWQSVMSLIYLIKGDNLLHWRETSVSYLSLSLSLPFLLREITHFFFLEIVAHLPAAILVHTERNSVSQVLQMIYLELVQDHMLIFFVYQHLKKKNHI